MYPMKFVGMCVLFCLIRVCYFNGTQEIIFNATIKQFFEAMAKADVVLVEYVQNGKVKFSLGR